MRDRRSVPWPDDEMQAEMELCTALMIASSGSDDPLTQDQVDQLLGVGRHLYPTAP